MPHACVGGMKPTLTQTVDDQICQSEVDADIFGSAKDFQLCRQSLGPQTHQTALATEPEEALWYQHAVAP